MQSPRKIKPQTGVIIVCLIAAVLTIVLSMALAIGPEGKFRDDGVASEELAFYEFKNGKVSLIISGGANTVTNLYQQEIGRYYKQNGQWIVKAQDGVTLQVRANLLWLQIQRIDGSWSKKHRRIFF